MKRVKRSKKNTRNQNWLINKTKVSQQNLILFAFPLFWKQDAVIIRIVDGSDQLAQVEKQSETPSLI